MSARRLLILVIVVILGALGCASVLPRSTKSDFFVLTALEPTRTMAATPSILLAPVVLPEYLDRPELVTRLASNQLRVNDLELWAEPLRESLPHTVEQNLAALLGGRVRRRAWTGSSPPELVVSVEVRRFEKTSQGRVELAARWTISESSGEQVSRETRLSYWPAGTSTRAAVASMSEALAALSRQIAADVQRLASPQASHWR